MLPENKKGNDSGELDEEDEPVVASHNDEELGKANVMTRRMRTTVLQLEDGHQ